MTVKGGESRYGKCRGCGLRYGLNVNGKVRRHKNGMVPGEEPCSGSLQNPVRNSIGGDRRRAP